MLNKICPSCKFQEDDNNRFVILYKGKMVKCTNCGYAGGAREFIPFNVRKQDGYGVQMFDPSPNEETASEKYLKEIISSSARFLKQSDIYYLNKLIKK